MADNKTEGTVDEAKGKAKQAAGDLTDKDNLSREGQVDEKAGEAKQKLGDAAEKAGDAADKAKEKAKDVLGRND